MIHDSLLRNKSQITRPLYRLFISEVKTLAALGLLELLAHLPSAGNHNNSSGSLDNQGSNGNLWSASVDGSNSRNLNFDSGDADWNNDNRANGLSVRCLRDYRVADSSLL